MVILIRWITWGEFFFAHTKIMVLWLVSGGYHMIHFQIKDMYNEIDKQRRLQDGDAKGALMYQCKFYSIDSMMFRWHTVDYYRKL